MENPDSVDAGHVDADSAARSDRYPRSLRILHWVRAVLVLSLIALGWTMVSLPDEMPLKYGTLYPTHKEFGVLLFCIAVVQLLIRSRSTLPALPDGLARWEVLLSKLVHRAMLVLVIVVPIMGYAMSSSFTMSDGVPFFFLGELPELLPKNDEMFVVFQLLHKVLAFTLLGLVVLHVLGVLKHRFVDHDRSGDVLHRML